MKTSTTARDKEGDTDNNTAVRLNRGLASSTPPGIPRWVKVIGIIVIALILAFVVLHLTGNSPFGPGSHTMPAGVIKLGVQQA